MYMSFGLLVDVSNCWLSRMAPSGQTSSHRAQYVHLDQKNSIRRLFCSVSETTITPAGQTFAQPPQPKHRSGSTVILPRKPGLGSLGSSGYPSVTRPAFNQISASRILLNTLTSYFPITANAKADRDDNPTRTK